MKANPNIVHAMDAKQHNAWLKSLTQAEWQQHVIDAYFYADVIAITVDRRGRIYRTYEEL